MLCEQVNINGRKRTGYSLQHQILMRKYQEVLSVLKNQTKWGRSWNTLLSEHQRKENRLKTNPVKFPFVWKVNSHLILWSLLVIMFDQPPASVLIIMILMSMIHDIHVNK